MTPPEDQLTKQLEFWKSDFGVDYAARGRNRMSVENLQRLSRDWGKILSRALMPYPSSILEVGCNIGRNLAVLKQFVHECHGVEPNKKVCEIVQKDPLLSGITLHQADGFRLPYADQSIDLVFTSGVLIHVAPKDLGRITTEIHRVAKHYIVCIEYFSHVPETVSYHGRDGVLFKRDFGSLYLDGFPDLAALDYGFLWDRFDSSDNSNWWLFKKG